MSSKLFNIGDRIRAIETRTDDADTVIKGESYTVIALDPGRWPIVHTDRDLSAGWDPELFDLVEPGAKS